MGLDARELLAVQVSERTMSVLSILGSFFIITSFLKFHYFRKPINRLVFYASFGNMLTNVATLISTSALPGYTMGYNTLCEFQGILIQWFMMADTLWVFSMALNVMLVFFRGYNSQQLRRLEKWYLLFSYGAPGCIAISYIVMNHSGSTKRRIIGPATIWCWVSKDSEWMRLAFFYAPIWVIISATMCIYIATGRQIFKKRRELRSFSKLPDDEGTTLTNPFTAGDFRNIKVETELKIESSWKTTIVDTDSVAAPPSRNSFSSTKDVSDTALPQMPTRSMPRHADVPRTGTGYKATAFSTIPPPRTADTNTDAKHSQSFSMSHKIPNRRRAAEGNAAAWGYFKVAFLMFTALFIVWVPSTVNRVQQFFDKGHPIFGLNLASALVLPLQGFWNAMIYISTTWPECKRALTDTLDELSSFKARSRTRMTRRPWAKDGVQRSDVEQPHLETPIALGAMMKDRPESQRYLQSVSSAESIRPVVAQSEV